MKKLFLWILIFIQPLLIAIAAGFFCAALFIYFDILIDDSGNTIPIFFFLGCIIGLIPGIVISIFIYKKHLSSKQFED